MSTEKSIHVRYFAVLREKRGISQETVSTTAETAGDLYQELKTKFHFLLESSHVKVALNDEFRDPKTLLKSGDTVVFIPPVAGG
ncbi:MAG: molybdopterin converting factor subunit 1 [Candidatus Omnitrophota bacterium]|nr:molybdopterin converting factor subunit 1 [Candidatus Omnitrophota bacterium]MDZ4243328.1 molybdopterin converting factor subunit 1 [Candidatus Omnitrophota bacterium]